MNNSIRKCGPTFFIPWDTVDSMFSLWTKQYFGDQVIRMHLDYDLHDNYYLVFVSTSNTTIFAGQNYENFLIVMILFRAWSSRPIVRL